MNIDIKQMPDYEMEVLASVILKEVQAFFAQPGVQEEFEIWQEEYHRTGKIFNSKLKDTKCCDTYSPVQFAALAESLSLFDGIGIYDNFIHLDVRGVKARWDYRTKK